MMTMIQMTMMVTIMLMMMTLIVPIMMKTMMSNLAMELSIRSKASCLKNICLNINMRIICLRTICLHICGWQIFVWISAWELSASEIFVFICVGEKYLLLNNAQTYLLESDKTHFHFLKYSLYLVKMAWSNFIPLRKAWYQWYQKTKTEMLVNFFGQTNRKIKMWCDCPFMNNHISFIYFHRNCQCTFLDSVIRIHMFGLKWWKEANRPDWHGVDKEEIEDEVEEGVRLPHGQGDLKL